MPLTAVVVGPSRVRASGGSTADDDVVAAALDGIDDEFVLLDDQPVTVGGLWREVFAALLDRGSAALICPSWWSERRIATVSDAAHAVVARVEVSRRSDALTSAVPRPPDVLVEVADGFVALTRPPLDRPARVVPRDRNPPEVADEVAQLAGGSGAVVVDRADGAGGAQELSALIAGRLRADGSAVTVVDDDRLLRAVQVSAAGEPPAPCARFTLSRLERLWPWSAAAAGVAVAGIAVGVSGQRRRRRRYWWKGEWSSKYRRHGPRGASPPDLVRPESR